MSPRSHPSKWLYSFYSYSDLLSPKSTGEHSISNYTDYMISKNPGSSPDRLKILKETIRTNGFKGESAKLLQTVQKRSGMGSIQRMKNSSITQTSLYSIRMKNRIENSSVSSSRMNDIAYKTKSVTGKMDYSEVNFPINFYSKFLPLVHAINRDTNTV